MLWLAGILEINSQCMCFGTSDVLQCMRYWITPVSFSRATSVFFGSTSGISCSHFGIAKDVYNSRRMRMHRLFLAGFEAVFQYSHLLIFKQDFVTVAIALPGLVPLSFPRK